MELAENGDKDAGKAKTTFLLGWMSVSTGVNCIANSTQCIAAKGPVRRTRRQLQQYYSGAPFERITMNVAGPFPICDRCDRLFQQMAESVWHTQSRGEHNRKCFCEQLGLALRGSYRTTFRSKQKFRVSCIQGNVWSIQYEEDTNNTASLNPGGVLAGSSERATELLGGTHSEVSTGVLIGGPWFNI